MALAADIANKSIREAIATIASEVDKLAASPVQDVSALTGAIADLRAEVKALNIAINGEPGSGEQGENPPAPTVPV